MRHGLVSAAMTISFVITLIACKKTADNKPNFEASINSYYQSHPSCLWSSPQRLPIQIGHDDPKTAQFDALVDQGLLARTTTEKKIIIISKRENNYDISDSGRNNWTSDPSQPGYGNFCYGHRTVSSIDSYTPTNDNPGAKTTVQYHWKVTGVPAWASAAETQTAYPKIAANISDTAKAANANLTNTPNGWVMNMGRSNDSDLVE
jgi:hypothetical protein